jgi:beta-barrel assembly-enhancing protease
MRASIFFACLLFAGMPGARADGLPDLGEESASVISPTQERELGLEVMGEIRADKSYWEDFEIIDYLQQLGYRLVAASNDTRQDFEFFLMRDNTVNAFALPGGFVGVHSGLITTAQTESELASVLGHEIAHVTQHHLARMIAGQSKNTLTTLAALAVAILAARSNSDLSSAAIAAAQAQAIQSQLDFTRENEREADRFGLETIVRAGFDPRAMPTFFERLQRENRVYDSNAPQYLRTHPLTTERIADIGNRVEKLPYRQVPSSLDFHLVRVKIVATQMRPPDAVREYESALHEQRMPEAAQRYGLALALMRAGKPDRAAAEVAKLRAAGASSELIEGLAAQIQAASGDKSGAVETYAAALKRYPQSRSLTYGYLDGLVDTRQPDRALRYIDDRLLLSTSDYRLYELRARAYSTLGKHLLEHQALAESYVRRGNVSAAIDQLQIALRSGDGDFYETSSAEARLKELRQQQRNDKKARPGQRS